jgi:glycosyltransferase involved in cell wall biosynthesis
MRPDVAIISPYPPAGQHHGGHSGVASYTANLAGGLAVAGLDVTVVAPELDGDPAGFTDGPVSVLRAFPFGPRALPVALRAAAATGAPVVHLQWELFLYGGPGALAGLIPALVEARRHGTAPLVTTMHQVVRPATVDRSYTALHRVSVPPAVARLGIAGVQSSLLRASAATIVHEEAFRSVVPGVVVVPHGVEAPKTPDREAARRRLGLDDRFVALCFGFLAPYKGIEVALDAARLAGNAVRLVVAGGEHPRLAAGGSEGYGAELRRRHRDALFTGYVADADVADWFAAADVALLPYPKPFSASGVLALALAHGTPVLLSPPLARCAGAPSPLTAPLDPPELAHRLRDLATDADAVNELRRWTEIFAAGRSWESVGRRTADVYRSVLTGVRRLAS